MGAISEGLGEDLVQITNKKRRPTEGDFIPAGAMVIESIPHAQIKPWDYADRPLAEFGDMNELCDSIELHGQEIPILVRRIENDPVFRYEAIYGRRRLEACSRLNLEVKAIAKTISDADAFSAMAVENYGRKNLSSWAKCISYKTALAYKIYSSIRDLAEKCGISRRTATDIMSYEKLPDIIKEVIPLSHVGIKGCGKMLELIKETDDAENIFLSKVRQFEQSQNIGAAGVERIYLSGIKKPTKMMGVKKIVRDRQGKILFTLYKSAHGDLTVKVPKGVSTQRDIARVLTDMLKG